MSFLLMVFLTMVCLFDKYPAPPWGGSPLSSILLTVVAVLLLGVHAYFVSRRVSIPLARDPSLRDRVLRRYERGRFVHHLALCGTYVLILGVLGWGWALRELWRWPGLELLTLAPFFGAQVLSWLCFYDADRASDRAAHRLLDADPFAHAWLEPRPSGALALPPFGGRWTYVGFQARQKLALVCIPLTLLILQKELGRLFPTSVSEWQWLINLGGPCLMVGVFIAMPWIVRLVLGLKPLPPGPLRDRLLAASQRLRFRCSNILLWNTRSGMANALVIGIVPWVRYVVFTDRLIEEFPEDEVEAVFGHEVGHIRHYHMPFYLGFLTLSLAVLGILAGTYLLPALDDAIVAVWSAAPEEFQKALPPGELFGPEGELAVFPLVAFLLAYIFVVFGFLSRHCERQADVFGCRAVSCGDPACRGHDPDTSLGMRGTTLCPTGILTFIRALEKVALVNGISRDRPGFLQSWQHSTIARRVAFLHRVLEDPAVETRFQRRLAVIKWGLALVLGTAFAWFARANDWQI